MEAHGDMFGPMCVALIALATKRSSFAERTAGKGQNTVVRGWIPLWDDEARLSLSMLGLNGTPFAISG